MSLLKRCIEETKEEDDR